MKCIVVNDWRGGFDHFEFSDNVGREFVLEAMDWGCGECYMMHQKGHLYPAIGVGEIWGTPEWRAYASSVHFPPIKNVAREIETNGDKIVGFFDKQCKRRLFWNPCEEIVGLYEIKRD